MSQVSIPESSAYQQPMGASPVSSKNRDILMDSMRLTQPPMGPSDDAGGSALRVNRGSSTKLIFRKDISKKN